MHRISTIGAAVVAFALSIQPTGVAQQTPPSSPAVSIDALISLKRAQSPVISPDGRRVAFTIRDANWDDNAYHTDIWLADASGGDVRQLTSGKKSSGSPAWAPDSSRLAFASERDEKRQIYLIDPRGGEGQKLTSIDEGVIGSFAWSPDGSSIAFTSAEPKSQAVKEREKTFGEYDVEGQDFRMTHLWVINVATREERRLTNGAFTVGQFSWSPDGTRIAFDHRVNTDVSNGGTADISIVTVRDASIRPLVTTEGPDSNPIWSPDGASIAFESAMGKPFFYYTNSGIGVIPSKGGRVAYLTASFDEDPSLVRWSSSGIFFNALSRTWSYLYDINPATRHVTKHAPAEQWIGSGFSITPDARTVAFVASDASTYPEVYVAPVATMQPRKLTDLGAQTATWAKAPIEVVTWKSQDGATIEGVLHKPVGFTTGRKYPLLVVIHGGPTGVSRPIPYGSASAYPIDVWVARGALVLEPNYRGSAGYGEQFRSLNVRNLGVGDAWDVLSGIDLLIKEGLADADRIGAMGWSQGGYISAYLTTHDSARFKAVSVGAGISDWMTYYVNTDIHPFTRQYLKGTPWDDPGIYAKTSPITYIKGARAPTLIQHGATDQRVPLPNAYELYQGLQDMGVPSKLIVYKGFEGIGHGPSKPKSSRAVMQHNLDWFETYIWGASTASPTTSGSRR
jgi:dipeptidyl aminopeptidase/acylaminoacyl peptidase